MSLTIIPYEPKYAQSFKDLNIAWLKKYFYVEAKDTILLEKCEESIIDQGGFIFFARYKGQIVGCFSLIRINDTTYELGKMAVEPTFQGMKIGQRLLQFALDLAKEKGWKKLVLYSSTKLPTALHLYKKYGFKEVVLENDLPYARSDIKMELELNN
ncbi:GNAT family N-acetyltransferase [Flavobacteriaceae bacterium TP-CH-4]|uniref:GNAT family N-acetyltransferase n=1 Tax=Pelagihabitans pacificus TaxID=2696054 RepID=A0A967AZ55_9FLAO|nr:GNAT family N-acetyltransferase [Pelagihabitans pacificus]NHF59216.1 GNAT family N-acetyltransferase [Pelagihabitans pacificus]